MQEQALMVLSAAKMIRIAVFFFSFVVKRACCLALPVDIVATLCL